MTVDSPGEFPKHFVIKLPFEGQVRYFILETARALDTEDVLPSGQRVLSKYLMAQPTGTLIGPVPVCDDAEYMQALSLLETGLNDDPEE